MLNDDFERMGYIVNRPVQAAVNPIQDMADYHLKGWHGHLLDQWDGNRNHSNLEVARYLGAVRREIRRRRIELP